MTCPLSERAPSASNLTAKNRVWGFFENSNRTRPANRRKPSELRRKIRLTPTKTASGIPYWPSRDPIEEEGGINLYGFCYNSPPNYADTDGRFIIPLVAVGLAAWGGWELGGALSRLFNAAVEAQESTIERQEKREERDNNLSDPDCPNDELEASQEEFEESNQNMIEDMDELGDAGGEVPGTGMRGRPPVPSADAPKIIGSALNKLMGETIGK